MGVLGDIGHWVGKNILGQADGPPGTAGAAKPGDSLSLKQDPATGLWYDQTNGQYYQDQYGTKPFGSPNVAQQTGYNTAQEQALMQQLAAHRQAQQQAVAGQNTLAQNLSATIHGGGPSQAALQAQQGFGQIAAQQQSQAAAVGGAAAPLAQLAAMHNTGAAQIGANQAATLGRAKEVADAQGQFGNLMTNMAQQAQEGYNSDLSGAQNFGTTGANLATKHEGDQVDVNKANASQMGNRLTQLSGGGSGASAGGGALPMAA